METFKSTIEIAIIIVISLILIILGVETLDIFEKSKNKSYIVRTIGFILLISGVKIFTSFIEMIIVPADTRKNIRYLHKSAF